MKAVARYDFRLNEAEFCRLTIPEFWDLWHRHIIAFHRTCFLQGIVAASVWNVQRTQHSQHLFDPMEWVPRSQQDAQREELILLFRRELNAIPPAGLPGARKKIEDQLIKIGRDDVDEILEQIFCWIN
jgi:hypothetical protein